MGAPHIKWDNSMFRGQYDAREISRKMKCSEKTVYHHCHRIGGSLKSMRFKDKFVDYDTKDNLPIRGYLWELQNPSVQRPPLEGLTGNHQSSFCCDGV